MDLDKPSKALDKFCVVLNKSFCLAGHCLVWCDTKIVISSFGWTLPVFVKY